MEKVDRLGWTAGFSFTTYGVRVGVRAKTAAVLEQLRDRLPPTWVLSKISKVEHLYSITVGVPSMRPGLRRFNLLYVNPDRITRSLNLEEVLDNFEKDVKLYIAEVSSKRVFVHAGVVGWKGQAIVILGRSLSGKTTLVTEFLRAGATYYSDEYAVLDFKGRVHPYHKPLELRSDIHSKQEKWSVESLRGRKGMKPLPIGMVLVSSYKQGAQWRPKHLSSGQGALELLSNTISARRQPETAIGAFQCLAARATFLKSERGKPET